VTITPTDLGTYLDTTVDEARVQQMIDWATMLCQSVVNPLPDGADTVILDVVVRAYTNPTSAQQESVGPYTVGHGPMSGGLRLTRENKRTLRRLAGGGGAFTIDTTPPNAGQNLPWWDTNSYSGVEYGADGPGWYP